jgi:hypothetical protein
LLYRKGTIDLGRNRVGVWHIPDLFDEMDSPMGGNVDTPG